MRASRRIKALIAALALTGSAGSPLPAAARMLFDPSLSRGNDVPLPPRRPDDLIPLPPPRPAEPMQPQAQEAPAPSVPALVPEPAPDPACARVLTSAKLVAASVAPIEGPDGCGIAQPVKVSTIILDDKSRINLEPAATMRCGLAESLADWVRDDIEPAAEKSGAAIAKIVGGPGYECRSRNHIAGAKLSEHGKGNAYDLLSVVLRNGKTLSIDHQGDAREFMEQLKNASCARFKTVLGPGSDNFHENNLHVDLAERHGDYRMCQWVLTPETAKAVER